MSGFKKMMSYLGLADDEEYEEYDGYDDGQGAAQGSAGAAAGSQTGARSATRWSEEYAATSTTGGIRTLPTAAEPQASGVAVSSRSSVVRPITPAASPKPQTVAPVTFQDAQEIGDRFKAGVPVIVNLQNVDRDLMRRIIDFASGLTYGLGGEMEKTADRVFLLTPVLDRARS